MEEKQQHQQLKSIENISLKKNSGKLFIEKRILSNLSLKSTEIGLDTLCVDDIFLLCVKQARGKSKFSGLCHYYCTVYGSNLPQSELDG